jgi:hypothetical protein
MALVIGIVRAAHVVLALVWTGSQFYVAFLDRGVRAAGPSGGRVMLALQARRYRPTMLPVGAITIVTGLALYGWMAASSGPRWAGSHSAIALGIGGLAGIAALAIGLFVSRPMFQRLSALTTTLAGGTATPEQQAELDRLRHGLRRAARGIAALLLAALLIMALAPFA